MIEYLMLFTLGACCASLIWLAIWPALARRTERLARRRIEATLPMSVAEFAGERDQLRAALAVKEARLEKRAEALAAEHAQVLAEAGRRDARLAMLEEKLADEAKRQGEIAADLARADEALAELKAALETEQQGKTSAREQLASVETAHQALAAAHETLSDTAEQRHLETAALQAEREVLLGRLEGLEAAHQALRAEHDARAEISEARHVEIVGLKAERETLLERLGRLEQNLSGREARLAELSDLSAQREADKIMAESRSSDLVTRLAASDAHGARLALDLGDAARRLASLTTLHQTASQRAEDAAAELAAVRRELEVERQRGDRDADAAGPSGEKVGTAFEDQAKTIERQGAELRAAEGALEIVQAERDRLQAELARLAGRAGGDPPGAARSRRELAARIERLADDIAKASGAAPLPPIAAPARAPRAAAE